MINLVSYSQINLNLLSMQAGDAFGDLFRLQQGEGTYVEKVCEYAGRLCYLSTANMGKAPNFLPKRVAEGHTDIIEHSSVTVTVEGARNLEHLLHHNRYLNITQLESYRDPDDYVETNYMVTGNLRSWLDLFHKGILLEAIPLIKNISPTLFAEFDETPWQLHLADDAWGRQFNVEPEHHDIQKITLLSANMPVEKNDLLFRHGSATFLLEGISRTATHQLVRHRLGSYSQESQRYVDLSKGKWQPVIPPTIAAKPEANDLLLHFFQIVEASYALLREMDIPKEDARFLLPGATESRMVMTMPFYGWQNFLEQRLPKAAQWEIRNAAQAIQRMLNIIAPEFFPMN